VPDCFNKLPRLRCVHSAKCTWHKKCELCSMMPVWQCYGQGSMDMDLKKYSPVSSLPVIFITLIPFLHERARNSTTVHARYNVFKLGDPDSPRCICRSRWLSRIKGMIVHTLLFECNLNTGRSQLYYPRGLKNMGHHVEACLLSL